MSTLDNIQPRQTSTLLANNSKELQSFDTNPATQKPVSKIKKPIKIKNKIYSTYLSSDLIERLTKVAKQQKIPANEIIKQALNEFLDNL